VLIAGSAEMSDCSYEHAGKAGGAPLSVIQLQQLQRGRHQLSTDSSLTTIDDDYDDDDDVSLTAAAEHARLLTDR